MSRQQDQFIDDDEEEVCPLCVEELDLTDKGFRPCQCGYQICQFCYNNVKNNMNGLCPACRRPYNDADVVITRPTAEEMTAYKARQAQKQKKTQVAMQKEKQRAEADNLSRKHLAGLRVVQKNLVYVTGLQPAIHEDQLLQTLRGPEYFGQYGRIIKIVVSKAKDPAHPNSVGVYVTFERTEDAEKCILAVNGSKNHERTLRAQFGTTKYCSAYLRGETCGNRNCMFLHEPGEANESYSRADLSALNAGGSQNGGVGRPPPQSQQPVASAAQPMAREPSEDQPSSPSADRPALPSSASWASRIPHGQPPPRSESRATSSTADMDTPADPAPLHTQQEQAAAQESSIPAQAPVSSDSTTGQTPASLPVRPQRQESSWLAYYRTFHPEDLGFSFHWDGVVPTSHAIIKDYPPLFDLNVGPGQRRVRRRQENERQLQLQNQTPDQRPPIDADNGLERSGSLQLGGEPEERVGMNQPRNAISPPAQDDSGQRFPFGGTSPSIGERGLTPQQQHQQTLLNSMKSIEGAEPFANSAAQPNAFQQSGNPPGHSRNASRYSFANDVSASTNVKPMASAKVMNQQASIMPPATGNQYGGQQQTHGSQFYTNNVQGPPPGIKMTGTPPVSGGMTFGQGHGFATGGIQYGANAGLNANEERMRSLLRGREAGAPAGATDASKREFSTFSNTYSNSSSSHYHNQGGSTAAFTSPAPGSTPFTTGPPSYASLSSFSGEDSKQRKKKGKKHRHNHTSSSGDDTDFPPLRAPPSRQQSISIAGSRPSTPAVPPGLEGTIGSASRRSTPTVPPGLSKPAVLPDFEALTEGSGSRPSSRPSSRAGVKRAVSQIMPALPLRPSRPSTPAQQAVGTPPSKVQGGNVERMGTPTREPRHVSSKVDGQHESEVAAAAGAGKREDTTTTPQKSGVVSRDASPAVPVAKKAAEAANDQIQPATPKSAVGPAPAPKTMQPSAKGVATVSTVDTQATPTKQPQQPASTKGTKRTPPGKLDIAAAVSKQPADATAAADAASAAQRNAVQTPVDSLPRSQSPNASVSSPAIRTGPKTLRVVQTPRTETPPAEATPSTARLPSRQPSIASIQLPGTPSSEHVSLPDNLSMPSTSQSRANSPPPTAAPAKAPVKSKTQLKKERQERAKAIEEERLAEEAKKTSVEEPEQEAIISRKKKTKKEKEPKSKPKTAASAAAAAATQDSTPTVSRAASPVPKPAGEDSAAAIADHRLQSPAPAATPPRNITPLNPSPPQHHSSREASPAPPPTPPTLSAAQILADLQSSDPSVQTSLDSFFRLPTSPHFTKPTQPITARDLHDPINDPTHFILNLPESDVHALLSGALHSYHYGGAENRTWSRGMVTPAGSHLRALSAELEARVLELEERIHSQPEELRFHPTKPQDLMKFPALDLEALKRHFENLAGRSSAYLLGAAANANQQQSPQITDDTAASFVNEFVMPPLTPPPGTATPSGGVRGYQASMRGTPMVSAPEAGGAAAVPSVEHAERLLAEARRSMEESEGALRRMMKKNRKVLGLA
ncbi:hypothetical protein BDY17DRAFT_324681 [Neohortaea acidophila]|uniref:RING-type domain-containing protein n=1 Tax=Neohortaea acidophila TaxID=245834 RepID=A0A6A6PR53_9PEZI|nr:uncharacterized protein BDY17DRAFT_324681 [Neohortaea acidophila]KAF2482395.1 hypothetical protein BDY17DRAFT_324681 [Neohortaea acidophila]